MFRWIPIAAIVVSSVFRGDIVPWLHTWRPLEKSEADSKERIFLEIIMVLGQKIDKTGTDSKL